MGVMNRIKCSAVDADFVHCFENAALVVKQIRFTCAAKTLNVALPFRYNAIRRNTAFDLCADRSAAVDLVKNVELAPRRSAKHVRMMFISASM